MDYVPLNLRNGWTDFQKFFLNERCALLECHRQHFLLNFYFFNIDFGKKRLKNDHFGGFPPVFCHKSKSYRPITTIFGM